MATKITRKKQQLQEFSVIANTLSKKWSADQFALAFLGKDNLDKLNSGTGIKFKSFEIWKESGSMFMRHKERDGKTGSKIEITTRNAERIYFASCVENHLLSDWPHVTYEQPDGDGGRVDVVLWSGAQGKGGKVLAIYENKQANCDGTDFPLAAQREEAISQAISRIENFHESNPTDLGTKVALSICLFDKARLNLSSAGEYYNNHAKTLNGDDDRLALAERALESSGMWIESWIVDIEEFLIKRPDQRKAWLIKSDSATSSPMIPLAAKNGSRVAVSGLDESIAKNRIVYSKMSQMMNYPFLNPAGFSDAQNTRDMTESKARTLAPAIANSILSNMSAWKSAGGSETRGLGDEGFFTLGANDRELHLVQASCFEAEGARGSYERVWMCGDVGFANGQHSTLAFQMIREALKDARLDSPETFKESFAKSDAFTGLGSVKSARAEMEETLHDLLVVKRATPQEIKYFFDNIIIQTSIKWARDDRHSWSLSFESNNAVAQVNEDILIHQHREQIKHALAALSAECSRHNRTNPLVMAKNHQSAMMVGMSREDSLVQLQDATQWLAADSMFRTKKWGNPDQEWRDTESNIKNFTANKTTASARIQEIANLIDSSVTSKEADQMAADLLSYQSVYKSIFASTKAERETVYKDIKKTLMAGDDLSTSILEDLRELRDDFKLKDKQTAFDAATEYKTSLTKHLTTGVAKGWIESKTAQLITLSIEVALEKFQLGKLTSDRLIQTFTENTSDAIEQINENGSTPNALHAAAVCAKALADFKTDACKRATSDHAILKAKTPADPSHPKTKNKPARTFSKFSEVLSMEQFSFWSKEASFDMLVAASLARAHGSVLAHGEYKVEPEKADSTAWPELLAERVKTAASLALQKIEILTRTANLKEGALVSHYFRHGYGALRLVGNDSGSSLISDSLNEAGIPTDAKAFNFYEWIMNSGLPSKPGVPCTVDANPVHFLDESIRDNLKITKPTPSKKNIKPKTN
jgi:hypothetical protein